MTALQTPQPAPAVSSPTLPRIAGVVTIADLLDYLDGVPAERVRMHPLPGTATEQDVIDNDTAKGRVCELVSGVLVEKPMGIIESMLAMVLGTKLVQFVTERNLGIVTGSDGIVRLMPGLVRGPDVAFISWERLPGRRLPESPVPHLAPDLVVEILSASNTKREMQRKLGEYFGAGVRLAWYIDPGPRTVAIYTSSGEPTVLTAQDELRAGDVLPGFALSLRDFFATLDRTGGTEPASVSSA